MKKIVILFFTITFCVITLTAFAQTEQKKLALVIGNSNYQHGGSLKNPVNDAELMKTTLQELGFTVIIKKNANLQTMQLATAEFTDKIKNYDVALFYYAGHGIQVDGTNYLIPIDAKLETQVMCQFEAFDINSINKAFMENSNNINIMILDACRDNPYRSWMRGGTRGFVAVTNQPAGTIIAFATREGETACDGNGNNGLYTEILAQEMKKTQNITEVFQNTRVKVLQKSSKKQCPQEWNMLTGNFYFTKDGEWIDENKYGKLDIYTEIAGNFFIDGEKIGYFNKNVSKTRTKVATGNHTYKIVGTDETQNGNITVYENQTAYIEIKSTNNNNLEDQFTDNRDGKVYKIVTIGTQTWMAENLNYVTDNGCWWYADNPVNGFTYGRLYDWETATKVCPDGWHLPSDEEWALLEYTLGRDQVAGAKLKAETGWQDNEYATNETEFSALPGGWRDNNGGYAITNSHGFWWSDRPNGENAWHRQLYYESTILYRSLVGKTFGLSVRCIKD